MEEVEAELRLSPAGMKSPLAGMAGSISALRGV